MSTGDRVRIRGVGELVGASAGLGWYITNSPNVTDMTGAITALLIMAASWWNRIPGPAWALMAAIAIFSNLLLAYREQNTAFLVLVVLPIIVSIAFFLIADIDSPHGGVIRVALRNLLAISQLVQSTPR